MTYLIAGLNVLTLVLLFLELRASRSERQSLVLLVKSESVPEFIRAQTQLQRPPEPEKEEDHPVPLDEVDAKTAITALKNTQPPSR